MQRSNRFERVVRCNRAKRRAGDGHNDLIGSFSQNLSISKEKLTCLYTTNSRPTTKTQEDTVAEFGTVAGAKDIRTKSRSPRHGGIRKGTGDCPLGRASALGDRGFRFRRSGFPMSIIEEHI